MAACRSCHKDFFYLGIDILNMNKSAASGVESTVTSVNSWATLRTIFQNPLIKGQCCGSTFWFSVVVQRPQVSVTDNVCEVLPVRVTIGLIFYSLSSGLGKQLPLCA